MLGKEAVALADAWRPNGIGAEDKARWLSQIDGRLLKELYALYDGEEKAMPTYAPEGEEELLAPAPYDEIYVYGLCARYDFTMGEIERYNMDAMLFDETWRGLAGYLQSVFTPKQKNRVQGGNRP